MLENYFYEYAVVRLVPKVEREEFINVGVILFSKRGRFIGMKYQINEDRLRAFACEIDLSEIEENLQAFQLISAGNKAGGTIATWDIADRFRWLTATRSSCIQSSKPHIGNSSDLQKTLERLFEELVL